MDTATSSFYTLIVVVIIAIVIYYKNSLNTPAQCNHGEGLIYNTEDIGALFGLGGYKCSICEPEGGSYVDSNGYCKKCDRNRYFNGVKCVQCNKGEYLDTDTYTCECDTNSGFHNGKNGCTKCKDGEVYQNNICTTCKNGKIVENKCICEVGDSFYQGSCVPCKNTGGKILYTGDCICPSGMSFGPSGCFV